jgi:hypothetical protein
MIEGIILPITPDEAERISQSAQALVTSAEHYQITTEPEYTGSGELLKTIKRHWKDVEEQRKDILKPIDEARARVQALFKKPLDYLTQAEAIIKRAMLGYTQEQERLRRAEEARLQEVARKEREKLEREAAKLAAKGKIEKAEAKLEEAISIPMPVYAAPVAKVSGVHEVERWSAELVSKEILIQAVADGLVPLAAVEINMVFLNRQAVALKKELNYPGVKAVCTTGLSTRTV